MTLLSATHRLTLDAALARAVAAGAQAETAIRTASWGKLVGLADPFGHGMCRIEFLGRGYDAIADAISGPDAVRQ